MPTDDARALMRRCAAALAALLVSVWLTGLRAQTIESVLAPGAVIQGHAKVEHDCKQCHSRFDRAAQDALCIACHKEVGADRRAGTGLHGRRQPHDACRSCHVEHRGRDAKIAAFDTQTFDHHLTDFELRDRHQRLDCAKCHVPGKRWAQAPTGCVGCHAQDDVHKGGLGKQCDECHSARGWKEASFDHDRKTRFALIDKHAGVGCDRCHAQGRFKNTPRACVACHRSDDAHKGQYGERCESCHGARGWKPASFNHDTDTRFALKGGHRHVACSSCHRGSLFGVKLQTECVSCHQGDDKHQGTLGRRCADCHNERSWKEPPGFDHARSRFPLLGAHQRTPCKDCHADALYRQTPQRCVECHRRDDRHAGNLGDGCDSCHAEQSWKDVQGRFDHARTRFALRNAHAARSVRCADCHETLKAMRGTSMECLSCHRRDDRHAGTLGAQCQSCHGDAHWRVERFDHTRTRYPLLGRHQVVTCAACHRSLRFNEAASECIACHRDDDTHKASLGTRCESCHNERAWTLWSFDHDRTTRFALSGAHRQQRCAACHTEAAPPERKAAALSTDCLACHRKDDAHDGRFGRRCDSCHVSESWRRMRPGGGTRP